MYCTRRYMAVCKLTYTGLTLIKNMIYAGIRIRSCFECCTVRVYKPVSAYVHASLCIIVVNVPVYRCTCPWCIAVLYASVYKLKRCSKKECCKQCRHDKFMGTMTKRPVRRKKKNKAKIHFCWGGVSFFYWILYFVLYLFIYNCLNDFSKKCWVTALVRSITVIGGLN